MVRVWPKATSIGSALPGVKSVPFPLTAYPLPSIRYSPAAPFPNFPSFVSGDKRSVYLSMLIIVLPPVTAATKSSQSKAMAGAARKKRPALINAHFFKTDT